MHIYKYIPPLMTNNALIYECMPPPLPGTRLSTVNSTADESTKTAKQRELVTETQRRANKGALVAF